MAEPEKILDERKVGRRAEYLVQWVGLPEDRASWEPRTSLIAHTDILKAWKKIKDQRAVEGASASAYAPPGDNPLSPPRKHEPTQPARQSPTDQSPKRPQDEAAQSDRALKAAKVTEASTDVTSPKAVKDEAKPVPEPSKEKESTKETKKEPAVPTSFAGILSHLSAPPTPPRQTAPPTSPARAKPSPRKKESDYQFVPPPEPKKQILTPSQREALKEHEDIPFYSPLDYSRGADDTNVGRDLSGSITDSQEALLPESNSAGRLPPPLARRPGLNAPMLTWDTTERRSLLASNSGFPTGPDDFLQKLAILVDNAPLRELSQQQLRDAQEKAGQLLVKLQLASAPK